MTAEDFLAVQDQPAGSSPVAESFLDGPDAGMGSPMQGNPQGAFTAPSTVTPQSFGPSMAGSMLVASNGQPEIKAQGNPERFAFAPEESSSGPSLVDVASLAPEVAKQIAGGFVKTIGSGIEQTSKVINSIGGDPYGMGWTTPTTSGFSDLGHEINRKGQDLIDQNPDLAATSTGKTAQGYGNMTGVIGTSVVNPWAGGAIFAGGVAEHMADAAEKAGKSPEIVEQARQTGYGLGMATMLVPTGAVLKTLRGMNVNPYVRQLGENLIEVLPEASTQSKMLYTGIEAAKSGTIGSMSGAAYQIAQNAALNHYGDQKIPLTQGVGESAALFGIPSAIGGGIAAVSNLRAADEGASRMQQGIDAMPRANGTTVSEAPVPTAETFLDAPSEAAQSAQPISGAIEDVPKGAFTMTQDGTPPVRPAPEVIPMPSVAVQYLEAPASVGSPVASAGDPVASVGSPVASAVDSVASVGSPVASAGDPVASAEDFLDSPNESPLITGTNPSGALVKYPIVEIPIQNIQLSKDVPNFKENANPETGVVQGEELQGSYNRLGTGNIVLWKRNNGNLEVISGRHRLDLARRTGEQTIPAQVVHESEGFTAQDASTLDAELNIRDGQGTTKDYADYFRNSQIGKTDAIQGGLLSRAKGRSGWALGKGAGNDLYALYASGRIGETKAVAIAASAPGNDGLQRAAISRAANLSPQEIPGFMAMLQRVTPPEDVQIGLFGENDAELKQSEQISKAANAKVLEIGGQIASVSGAAKRPEAAARLGVDVRNPAALAAKLDELKAHRERYVSFWRHPEIMAELGSKPIEVSANSASKEIVDDPTELPTIATNGEGNLFNESALPFNLSGETIPPPSSPQTEEGSREDTLTGTLFDGASSVRSQKGTPPKQTSIPAVPTPEVPPDSPVASSFASGTSNIKSGVSAYLHGMTLPIRRVLFPATLDESASQIAHMIRDLNGARAIAIQRADVALEKWRAAFDGTPVLLSWKYDPTQPLPSNYAFIQAVETGNVANLPKDQQDLALLMRRQLDERIAQVQELNPEALKSLIDNYFPHVWKNPDAANAAISKVSPAARPLEGSKAFLRKRTLSYFTDGLKSGLVPVSDNPVDIHLFKLAEMDRFIMAHRILNDANAAGLRKFIGVFSPKPEGWSKVEDRTSTVFAPPFVTVKEAFDLNLRKGAEDFIKKMGWNYDRVIGKLRAAGFKRNTWGFWQPATDTLKVREFSTEKTLFHEIGHGMDQHFGLHDWLATRVPEKVLSSEMFKLSTAREPDAKGKHFDYIHSWSERMAEITAAYVTAPDFLRENCPETLKAYHAFLDAHPELWAIRDLRPGLERGIRDIEVPVHGQVTLGHWYMPDGAAQVLNNYLSPGLSNRGWYRSIRSISNLLNSATLGLSAFHLGFTSLEAVASQVSVGLWQALHGHPLKSAGLILSSPAAPVTNYYRGKALQRAMLHPDQATGKMRGLADLALKAGLRATIDPFWKTEFTRNFRKALAGVRMNLASGTIPKGEALRVITNLIPMIIEQSMRPIAEILVPRQKLGVFAEMMHAELQRLGPSASLNDLRAAAARSADSTEDRLGQMTYDNLFHNKVAKDLLLIAFRAYGWQLGKYRAISKAIGEGIGATNDLLHFRKPNVSTNLTYFPALVLVAGIMGAITQKILSGKDPESVKDLFLPRSGKIDGQGHEQRLALPTYLKDLISDWHDAPDLKKMGVSFWHKLNPALSIACDAFNNKDFYGTEIRHDDDPAWKQTLQLSQFLAKSFIPFSVTGTMKLQESGAGPGEMALPFIGIVPAKKVLTETPAEARAEELYAGTLPQGSRTQDQTDHAHLLNQIKSQMRMDPAKGTQLLAQNAGQLHTLDFNSIFKDNGVPQIILHTKQLTIDQGMSVFDMATDLERQQLAPVLLQKLGNAVNNRSIDPMVASRYAKVLTSPR